MPADCVSTQTGRRSSQDRRTADETSAIYELFGGTQLSTLKCMQCGEQSESRTPFLDLSLSISDDTHAVEDALREFMQCENLASDEGWRCPACSQVTRTTKQLVIETAPEGLILHLKRFRTDGRKAVKLDVNVAYGHELVVTTTTGDATYELQGVVCHSGGSCAAGHYYAYVRQPGGTWVEADDDCVSQVSVDKVLRANASKQHKP
eukprot:56897-Eustigmatos_ZCMA.PRE.1